MFTLRDFQPQNDDKTNQKSTTFLEFITRKWDELHEGNDVFRYKIDKSLEKVVDGYLLQLNLDRNVKRRQPDHIDNILQPFDKDKFNFTKASPKEVLSKLKNDEKDSDIHSIIVNVSPISRYHSLLCPSVDKCLPQVMTLGSLELAIEMMFCAGDRALRMAFNSLCAFASVNHLHLHLVMEKNVLPVEIAKCNHLKGPVYYLKDYPVPAFCFEVVSKNANKEVAKEIYKLLEYLLTQSIAHNIFLTKGESLSTTGEVLRVLVWPRKSSVGAKQLLAFNVAALELSGWFTIYDADIYNTIQTADLENELRKWKIDDFGSLCDAIKDLF